MAQLVLVLVIASVLVWGMLALLPGDAATAQATVDSTPQEIAAERARLGLDEPVPVQYWRWINGAARGNFGVSSSNGYAVSAIIKDRLPATVQLTLFSLVISLLIAVPLGSLAAVRQHSFTARVINGYCSLSLAIPSFWVGLLLIVTLGVKYQWIPTLSEYVPFYEHPVQALHNLAGPIFVIALLLSGVLIRFIRSSLIDVLRSPHINVAKGKGLGPKKILTNHAFRNAALPVVTILGLQLGSMFGGVVIVEAVFNYPGLGALAVTATTQRDYPLMQGIMLLSVVGFLVVNLAVDVIYALLDPRIRLGATT